MKIATNINSNSFHKKICILFFALIFGPLCSFSQTLIYDVVWKKDTIGQVHATKIDSSGFEVFHIQSEVRFWFLGKRSIETNQRSTYLDNILQSSHATYHRNNVLKSDAKTTLKNDVYHIEQDDQVTASNLVYPLTYSIGRLYHDEPDARSNIFSERFAENLNARSEGDEFVIVKPDGRENKYFYKNNICQKVEVDTYFTTFSFVLRRKQ